MQIYDFEACPPPVLNENLLRAELARRRRRRAVLLLLAAAVLLLTAVLLLGWYAVDWYPGLTALCLGYAAVTAVVFGIGAAAWIQRGRPGL